MATDSLIPDAPRVSRDAALELMVHHLQLAHMYFQNVPHDAEANKAEAYRLFTEHLPTVKRWKDDGGLGCAEEVQYGEDAPEIVAGMEWLARMEEIYAKMAEDQGD